MVDSSTFVFLSLFHSVSVNALPPGVRILRSISISTGSENRIIVCNSNTCSMLANIAAPALCSLLVPSMSASNDVLLGTGGSCR